MSRHAATAVFHEILLALAHEQARDDVLALIAEKARLLTESASAAVALLEEGREALTFVAVAGAEGAELLGTRVLAADTVAGHTALTGEPYLAFHPTPRPGTDPAAATRSAAVVAIYQGGRPVGALASLNKTDDAAFTGDDLMALSTLAAAASARIAAATLRQEASRQERELSVLYDAVRSVSGQLSLPEVLAAVVEQAAAHVESAAALVFLANDDNTHLYIAEERGLTPEMREITLPADGPLGRLVLGRSQPVPLAFLDEAEDAPLLPPEGALQIESPLPELGVRAALAASIRSGENQHGLVLVASKQPYGVYTAADANFLSALAAQAAVAIDNAYLYEDATRRAEEAATLYELSQAVSSTLRLPEVLSRVARAVTSLLAVDKFALFLREDTGERLPMVLSTGLAPGAEERIRPEIGQGIPGWVVEFETPTAVTDVAADHRNRTCPIHGEGVVSMMAMPLQAGTATIGVLCAMTSRRRLFTVGEMELAYTIANQAAIAIENARMYADVRQKSLELRKYFHRVVRALGATQSPQEVPELIATLAREVTGADRCALLAAVPDHLPALRTIASVGFRVLDPEPGSAETEAPAAWVARRARVLAIEDLALDERFGPDRFPRPARGRVAGYLGIPLRRGGDLLGVLEVYTRAPRAWRSDEIRLLLTFAAQAAVAFENALLAQQGGVAARDARLLGRLLTLMAPAPDDKAEAMRELLRQEFGTDDPQGLPETIREAVDRALPRRRAPR